MLKADKAKKIVSILNKIYPKTPIPLNHKNNFELLISVLLSAQCTDKRVNEATTLLFKKANNPAKMEKLPVKTIYNIIRPCGLAPQKSKAISKLSKNINEKL